MCLTIFFTRLHVHCVSLLQFGTSLKNSNSFQKYLQVSEEFRDNSFTLLNRMYFLNNIKYFEMISLGKSFLQIFPKFLLIVNVYDALCNLVWQVIHVMTISCLVQRTCLSRSLNGFIHKLSVICWNNSMFHNPMCHEF